MKLTLLSVVALITLAVISPVKTPSCAIKLPKLAVTKPFSSFVIDQFLPNMSPVFVREK